MLKTSLAPRQQVASSHGSLLRSASTLSSWLVVAVLHGCSGDVGAGEGGEGTPAGPSGPTVGPSVTGLPTEETPSAGVSPTGPTPTGSPTPTTATGNGPTSSVPSTTPTGTEPPAFAPAPGAYRRLTNTAFVNSLGDLLGGPVQVGALEPDSWSVGGLPTVGAAEVSISELGVEQYQSAVEAAVEQAFADPARRQAILGCSPTDATDVACFGDFVRSFGRKVFRGALSEAQVTRYVSLVSDVATTLGDATAGMKAAVTAFLLSPNFLYRMERGEPDAATGHWRYTSQETATRLAYFLTNSTPDAQLLDVAEQDGLNTADAIRGQAERLLSSEAGRESVGNFAKELFQLRLVGLRAKDPEMYPEYDAALQQAMAEEVPAMFESVVFDDDASALELFTTRKTFATTQLAAIYGLEIDGPNDGTLFPVTMPQERAGLLGTAAISTIYGSQKEGSPTLRGKFIREVLLCQVMPPPPADVSTTLEDPPAGVVFTKREKLTRHQEEPACAGCHSLMDPLGLTLESYDAIGRYRTTDQGKPIDLSGTLDGTDFNGGVELGELLASKPETAKCMLRSLYRYGTGHVEVATEAAVLEELNERFTAGGYKLRDLMLDIVTSDGFRYVSPPAP